MIYLCANTLMKRAQKSVYAPGTWLFFWHMILFFSNPSYRYLVQCIIPLTENAHRRRLICSPRFTTTKISHMSKDFQWKSDESYQNEKLARFQFAPRSNTQGGKQSLHITYQHTATIGKYDCIVRSQFLKSNRKSSTQCFVLIVLSK